MRGWSLREPTALGCFGPFTRKEQSMTMEEIETLVAAYTNRLRPIFQELKDELAKRGYRLKLSTSADNSIELTLIQERPRFTILQ